MTPETETASPSVGSNGRDNSDATNPQLLTSQANQMQTTGAKDSAE